MALKVAKTKKNLSFFGAAALVEEVLQTVNFNSRYNDVLPKLKYKGHHDSFYKFKAMVCSFLSECDCLYDIEELNHDPAYLELIDHNAYTAKTYGNYLRCFNPKAPLRHAKHYNWYEPDATFAARRTAYQ